MYPDPDHSAAHSVLGTDVDHLAGHPSAFTVGHDNEIQRLTID
jgi:hypothetical protein